MFRRTGKNLKRVEKKFHPKNSGKTWFFMSLKNFPLTTFLNKIQFLLETFFSTRSKFFSFCQNIITWILKRCVWTFGGRRPSVEDNLWWRMTFGERRPSVEDDLWWKTTFGGRRPLVEDELLWKTPFGRRRSLVEDDLRWGTTFSGRRPSVEDDLWWETTFGGRKPYRCKRTFDRGPFDRRHP